MFDFCWATYQDREEAPRRTNGPPCKSESLGLMTRRRAITSVGPSVCARHSAGHVGIFSQSPLWPYEMRALAVQGHTAREEQRKARSLVFLPSEPTLYPLFPCHAG